MERQLQINWPAIVEEAKQRRKAQNLTQKKLALLANVSTPTLSRFENSSKNIQLSSILNILKTLGMLDHRHLIFPETPNVQYDPHRLMVTFWGQDDTKSICCAISLEALEDHYKNKNKNPVNLFLENKSTIEHEAVRKYLNNQFESDNFIFIKTGDL